MRIACCLPPHRKLWERFLADYEARLLPELPSGSPCFFPFQRILFWASRPA